MTYNYLEIITSEDKTIPREGVIAINTDIPENPFLEVYSEGKWVPIDNYDTKSRMSRFEDLYTTLYEREWGIGPRLYIQGRDKLYMTLGKYDSSIPKISKKDPMMCVSESLDQESLDGFEDLYTKLMKVQSMNMNDIEIDLGNDYYRYLVSTRNLIDQSSIIDLYSYSENSTDYGNILNLNELLQRKDERRYQEGGYTIRLEVMYIKSGSRKSGTLIFEPYLFDTEGNLKYNDFQSTINNEVTVEIKKGCIRVFPDILEVTECIIYHCYVIYEKLV